MSLEGALSQSTRRRKRFAEAAVLALLMMATAVWRFGPTIADPDLWGHILNGLETLEAGSYLSVDSWSYLTQGQEWINHEWLGEWVMAVVYHYLASAGLVVLKATIALGTVAVLYWWAIRRGLPPTRAGLLTLLAVLALAPTLGTFRPQLFTVVGFVMILLVMSGVESGKLGLLWILPPVFALWANLHGGYVAGLAVVGVWALVHVWEDKTKNRYWPLVAFMASLFASFANPQGPRRLQFLLETAAGARPEIQDWQPVDLTSAVGLGYIVLVGVTLAALVVDRRNARWALTLPLVGLAIAPIVATRHLQLFAPAAIILGASHLAGLSKRVGWGADDENLDEAQRKTLALALTAVVIAASAGLGGFASCMRVDASQFEFPQRAAVAWATVDPHGNAVVPFNWGEYIRWHFGRDVLVSIDGRRETVYSDDIHQLNLDFIAGRENWQDLLALAPTNWILVPSDSPAIPLVLSSGGWHTAHRDREATLLSSDQASITNDDELPVDGDGSCFPAGPTDRGGGESFLADT